ncbi:crossover junction endodeoxyribonuclease RuvC [Candidatus Gottesmanbacteria bacterium]|nr:crossover junction endodeoxyribonuclease RuvC [Candidatus Gottesmanbacteria bacterium]
MHILGIDPGIERLGWAVILKEKNKMTAVSYGCLFTKKEFSTQKRLAELYDGITKEKEQVQKMVKNILHLDKIPTPDDTADALAVALTHCFVNKFNLKIRN